MKLVSLLRFLAGIQEHGYMYVVMRLQGTDGMHMVCMWYPCGIPVLSMWWPYHIMIWPPHR